MGATEESQAWSTEAAELPSVTLLEGGDKQLFHVRTVRRIGRRRLNPGCRRELG